MSDDWKRQIDRAHAALVRRDDPTSWVTEADAMDAFDRFPRLAVRGPAFGIAQQDPRTDAHWRLLLPVTDSTPQMARDGLNSHLWFKAKDDTDEPAVRRALLDAVAVLEREPVNELEVLGVRYRVVRGDEFTRIDDDGPEPPRPTDREPVAPSWENGHRDPLADPGYVLTPGQHDTSPATAALRLGLRGFTYTGERFPADVRADSERALVTHLDITLLPTAFCTVERGRRGWKPHGTLQPTPHDSRRLLYDAMTETWPLIYRFDDEKRAVYRRAAEEFRSAGRANEVRVDDTLFRICRVERLMRSGPDGPEPPRPSDHDDQGPMKMHPTMDEHGTLHYSEESAGPESQDPVRGRDRRGGAEVVCTCAGRRRAVRRFGAGGSRAGRAVRDRGEGP
ncbi:hypothetical protein OK074_1644 [Actinobacteria bacterium OK074]|nr:hypothetical protein OK074_1644 [Actinobacteria bacterium OK074]